MKNKQFIIWGIAIVVGVLIAIILGSLTFIKRIEASDFAVKLNKTSHKVVCECVCR